jgi:hypothetical protein
MREIINLLVTTVAIGLNTGQLQAAPGGAQVQQSFPSLKLLAQADSYYEGYLPSCPSGLFYACYFGSDGGRRCGCWPGGNRPACPQGYHYECRSMTQTPKGIAAVTELMCFPSRPEILDDPRPHRASEA